jgi:hypothetical protein
VAVYQQWGLLIHSVWALWQPPVGLTRMDSCRARHTGNLKFIDVRTLHAWDSKVQKKKAVPYRAEPRWTRKLARRFYCTLKQTTTATDCITLLSSRDTLLLWVIYRRWRSGERKWRSFCNQRTYGMRIPGMAPQTEGRDGGRTGAAVRANHTEQTW